MGKYKRISIGNKKYPLQIKSPVRSQYLGPDFVPFSGAVKNFKKYIKILLKTLDLILN